MVGSNVFMVGDSDGFAVGSAGASVGPNSLLCILLEERDDCS